MANILIIGGGGFIGSNLVKAFNGKHNVLIYDASVRYSYNTKELDNKINIVTGTLNQFDYLVSLVEKNSIDTIIHLASGLLPGSSFEEYTNEYETIIIPTIKLFHYSSKKKIKVIYFSSGGTIYGTTLAFKVNETHKSAPICYYGLSKQILEDALLFQRRASGLEYLIIRPSNLFGPGQNPLGRQGLIATSIWNILHHKKIIIWGDGNIVRDYLYINDLNFAIGELIDRDIRNEIVNIGSGIGYSVNEIIHKLKTLINKDVDIEYTPGRKVDVPSVILDNSKLKALIPFTLTPLETGMSKFLDFILHSN